MAIWPPNDVSPRSLDATLGVLTLVLATITLTTPRLMPWWADFSLLLSATGMFIIVATRATVQGLAVIGCMLGLLCVITALYLPVRRLLIFLVYYLVGFLVALQFPAMEMPRVYVVVTIAVNAIMAAAIYRLVAGLRDMTARLADEATRDPLTGLLNRRGADIEAAAVRAVAQRSAQAPSAVAVLDLDDFKRINDEKGHLAGDRVLRRLAAQWKAEIRSGDVLARVGGDEFILVMPDTTVASAKALLDRMLARSCHAWSHGVAEWGPSESLTDALRKADNSMYVAKTKRQPAHPEG